MDIKIPEKDKSNFIEVVFDSSKSFKRHIVNFARVNGYALSSKNSFNYNTDDEKCNMIAYQLNNNIEIGYFFLNLRKSIRIIEPASLNKNRIFISFIYSAEKKHITSIENAPKKGVSNRVFLYEPHIKIINSIERGSDFYLLKISFKKKMLQKLFGMPVYVMTKILQNKNPKILYVQLDTKILNVLESMELSRIPQKTKIPYLLGKSYELMALVLEDLTKKSTNRKSRFTDNELEKLLSVRSFILRDWKNPPTTQKVSAHLGMSATKAKVMFKRFFGKPIYRYFKEKRLEEGMNMINKGEHTVTEIGHALGFKNPSHFADCFRKKYNILPKNLLKTIN